MPEDVVRDQVMAEEVEGGYRAVVGRVRVGW
jgi:hypothetical protein